MQKKSLMTTIVEFASGEWVLTSTRPNGGEVIIFRSLWVALQLTIAAMALHNWLDPDLVGPITWECFRIQLLDIAPWSVAAVGLVYTAFYTRFSAQWSYMADLYNQIKTAEVELANSTAISAAAKERLAEWKAGYIEDAQSLHLQAKVSIAAVIHHWGADPLVATAFDNNSPGGKKRLDCILAAAEFAYKLEKGRWEE